MRLTRFAALAAFTVSAWGQQWEVGALAGAGFYRAKSVTGPRGSGEVDFKPGISAGGWIGHNAAGRWGGEIRYLFQNNPMKVSGQTGAYEFGGRSHIIHYDVLIHASSREDRVRPFVAVGAGAKGYQGTGVERAVQPLSNLAILTRTKQWQPVLSFGAGIKWAIAGRMMLRVEVRDYASKVPTDVILPAPGAKLGGWLHDITPMVGLSYLFH